MPVWRQRLIDNPDDLEALEREVHDEFVLGADMIVAGLLSVIFKMPELAAASEQTRRQFQQPVTRGRFRRVKIKLLLARTEFERSGLKLDIKSVRRIANQCGEELLKLRKAQLMQWRDGKLPAGDEFNGQRVTVQIDGGRTKIRSMLTESKSEPESRNEEGFVDQDAPGRSKPKSKRSFQADWREPKLVTIFVHDERGRMVKESQATIDGTMKGPAANAKCITFVADGAPWIWDRIDRIVSKAQILATVKIHQILDNCHASHHISRALASLGFNDKERMAHYRAYRTMMRNGKWCQVVEGLSGVAEEQPDNKEVQTEIDYLKKHGEAGRLSYPHFRTLGLPLGSGAMAGSAVSVSAFGDHP